jgi:L-ascorbate metabolism protein UlaG (beta-lactamase superfamily)
MRLRLLRHATLLLEYAGVRLLVDPMLGRAGSQPPMPDTDDPRPNPLVDLPVAPETVVAQTQAVLVSHLHGDHVDADGVGLLPRDVPVVCPPAAAGLFAARGLAARPLETTTELGPIRVTRTGGRHGHGAIGREMGEVSGFVLQADGEPGVYIAGDTVWCADVESALASHWPDVVVVNAGAARFRAGEPITMDAPDVAAVCRAVPHALVVAVHMEAMSHCGLGRDDLRAAMEEEGLGGRVLTPADGETLELAFG